MVVGIVRRGTMSAQKWATVSGHDEREWTTTMGGGGQPHESTMWDHERPKMGDHVSPRRGTTTQCDVGDHDGRSWSPVSSPSMPLCVSVPTLASTRNCLSA